MSASIRSITAARYVRFVVFATLASLAGIALPISDSLAQEVVVIVNPANATASLTQADLARIFLGRATTFPNGEKAVPLNQAAASSVRTAFDQKVLGKNSSQMQAYWARQMFSGEGVPPVELADDAAVLARVAADPDAIGYISAAKVNSSVKVVYK